MGRSERKKVGSTHEGHTTPNLPSKLLNPRFLLPMQGFPSHESLSTIELRTGSLTRQNPISRRAQKTANMPDPAERLLRVCASSD
ncbi:MAG: hypothetical protein MK179_21170 [Pirellulaceae bacterium]|nr:hypothetical protein [Pirellulaceae bacterium]